MTQKTWWQRAVFLTPLCSQCVKYISFEDKQSFIKLSLTSMVKLSSQSYEWNDRFPTKRTWSKDGFQWHQFVPKERLGLPCPGLLLPLNTHVSSWNSMICMRERAELSGTQQGSLVTFSCCSSPRLSASNLKAPSFRRVEWVKGKWGPMRSQDWPEDAGIVCGGNGMHHGESGC